jgi:hypothetical protein
MGNLCSKAQVAKTYLSNDFLKNNLNIKGETLAAEQLRIIKLIESELNNDSAAVKSRTDEIEHNKLLLLDAILQQKPTDELSLSILENNIKLMRLKDLESQLSIIKNQSQSVAEILEDLDKAMDAGAIPILKADAPIAVADATEVKVPDVPVPLIDNSNNIMPLNLDTVTQELEQGLEKLAPTALSIGKDVIDGLMGDIRITLQNALAEALKKL